VNAAPATLYVIATPIGNLDDITYRAVGILRTVGRIAAEDTRRTRALLSHLGIVGKPLDALHQHSSAHDIARLVSLLESGASIALVTDAGTPTVSDPGDALVKAAILAQVRVVPLPGASAVLAALAASGLGDGTGFRFCGFLPRDGTSRRGAVATACSTPEPVILFESPERTLATLRELADAMPDRPACVARELTKVHEQIVRGTLTELARCENDWRGEITIVLGSWSPKEHAERISDEAVDARIDHELDTGAHAKAAAERIAAWSGRPKREIYERVVRRKTSISR
jgi:16S rRNA (cytidine1402-2'-O)-methyltransferase